MKKPCISLLLLSCISITVCAQEKAPELLVKAAQCLAVKNHLPPSKAAAFSFGYLVDSKSYPGEKVLYVVNYTRADRSKGMVFTIFLTEKQHHQVFNVQNNATFIRSRNGIDFVDPPLGGTWTQQHLVSAIKQIERPPIFTIPSSELVEPSTTTQCKSYADPRVPRPN